MQNFGTDGIRGKAEQFTPEFLAKILRGLVDYADRDNFKIFLAGDTRESSEWIIRDLETACETFGVEFSSAGVLPTPAINFCFAKMGFDFAIDVTASHNPYTDNGIKIFELGPDGRGQKLGLDGRAKIEASLKTDLSYSPVAPSDRADISEDAVELYKEHLKNYLGSLPNFTNNLNHEIPNNSDNKLPALQFPDFHGFHLGMDCANGATSVINKTVFEQLGATVDLINCCKNYNTEINQNCGSTHLEALQKLVLENHLDFGVAFDGDGDRVLMIDETGAEIDGDQILAILAKHFDLDSLAITVMANQGLLSWAKNANVNLEITAVGDSNVAEAMRAKNIQLGGEQSGHIILPGQATGDGMLTALVLTSVIASADRPLSSLASIITKFPQVIINLPATPEQKQSLKTSDAAKKLLLDFNNRLQSVDGRLLVRPSGTENLIRITMWGRDESEIGALAQELKTKLGEIL